MPDAVTVSGSENAPALPPVIAGANTPEIERRFENFFHSVAAIFEAWVGRRKSDHTRRAYRGDVMTFGEFRGFAWPQDAAQLLRVSILDVQAFKDHIAKYGSAPKTINRRISSLSSFYKFLSGSAAELRLPITIPNPAYAQFISRESSDPVDETCALSETRARQLMGMPAGDSLLDVRDRARLRWFAARLMHLDVGIVRCICSVTLVVNISGDPSTKKSESLECIVKEGQTYNHNIFVIASTLAALMESL
jgi:hypothetical protein